MLVDLVGQVPNIRPKLGQYSHTAAKPGLEVPLLTRCTPEWRTNRKIASLTIFNRAGDVVADGVTAETFLAFRRRCGKGAAVVVELTCGEEIMVDTVGLLRKLPRGAIYKARLLRRTTEIPKGLENEAALINVWVEA